METAPKKKFIIFRWIDSLCAFFGAIAAAFLMIVALIVVFEVFMRYIGRPTIWVAETSIYLTMAVGLLAAAYALRENMHFSMTFLTDRISARNHRRLRIVTHLMGIAYSSVYVVKGLEMAKFSYEFEDVSTGLLETPLWIPNALLPIAGALLALQFLSKLSEEFTNQNPQ